VRDVGVRGDADAVPRDAGDGEALALEEGFYRFGSLGHVPSPSASLYG
jgi:hypothetical protein